MPQSTIFRFTDHKATYLLINHVLHTLKYYVYKTRENGSLELKVLKGNIQKIKNIEKQISLKKPEKQKILNKIGAIVRKHIGHFLKYMVVLQLGGSRGNVVLILILFSILVALLSML